MRIAVVIVSQRSQGHDVKRVFVFRSPKKAFDWVKNRLEFVVRRYRKKGVTVQWHIFKSKDIRLYTFGEFEISFFKTQFFKMKTESDFFKKRKTQRA